MGKNSKYNRECVAKGYIRKIKQSTEPIIINDEEVVKMVKNELGDKIKVERVERGPYYFLYSCYNAAGNFKRTPPGRIAKLILRDRVHNISEDIISKVKESIKNAPDWSRRTIDSLTFDLYPGDFKRWGYYKVGYKIIPC